MTKESKLALLAQLQQTTMPQFRVGESVWFFDRMQHTKMLECAVVEMISFTAEPGSPYLYTLGTRSKTVYREHELFDSLASVESWLSKSGDD